MKISLLIILLASSMGLFGVATANTEGKDNDERAEVEKVARAAAGQWRVINEMTIE